MASEHAQSLRKLWEELARDPGTTKRWSEAGTLGKRLGRLSETLERIGAALEASPDDPEREQAYFEVVRRFGERLGDPRLQLSRPAVLPELWLDPGGARVAVVGRSALRLLRLPDLVQLWEVPLRGLERVRGFVGGESHVAVSPFASGASSGSTELRILGGAATEGESPALHHVLPYDEVLAVSPSTRALAARRGDRVLLVRVAKGLFESAGAAEPEEVLLDLERPYPDDRVLSAAALFSPDGARLLVHVHWGDPPASPGRGPSARDEQTHPDDDGVGSYSAHLLDAGSGAPLREARFSQPPFRWAWSPTGTRLALVVQPRPARFLSDEPEKSLVLFDGSALRGIGPSIPLETTRASPPSWIGDGKVVVAAGEDLAVFPVDSSAPPRRRLSPGILPRVVLGLADPDRVLVSDGTSLELLDPVSGRAVARPRGHRRPICDLEVDPEGRRVATLDLREELRVWELATGRCLWSRDLTRVLPAPSRHPPPSTGYEVGSRERSWGPRPRLGLRWLPGPLRVLVWWEGGFVLLDGERGDPGPLSSGAEVPGEDWTALAATADGRSLLVGTAEGRCLVIDPATGATRSARTCGARGIRALALTDDEERFVTRSGQELRVWEFRRRDPVASWELPPGRSHHATHLLPHPDGETLVLGGWRASLRRYALSGGEERPLLEEEGPPSGIPRLSADGRLLALATWGGYEVWDLEAGARRVRIESAWSQEGAIGLVPSGDLLLHGEACHVCLRDLRTSG